jgi:hypothetical protein
MEDRIMGYIDPLLAEESIHEELEAVTKENISQFFREGLNRPKQFGRLTVMYEAGPVVLGRWLRSVDGELIACPLEGDEAQEATNILEDMEVDRIYYGHVLYKPDCPIHFEAYGVGVCFCKRK